MKNCVIALGLWASLMGSAASAGSGMAMPSSDGKAVLTESGQGAFAAIHEIVGLLEADPATDWSKVNIDALRAHLVDMDNVTLHALVSYDLSANGETIHVRGDGEVKDSIQRMVSMHATMAGDTPDWHLDATKTADGVDIALAAKSAAGLQKAKALGLFGILADGMHHQMHHMMLARGTM